MCADDPTRLPQEMTQSPTSNDLSDATAGAGPYPYDKTWELPPLPPPPPASGHARKRLMTLLLLCLALVSASAGVLVATLYWRSQPGALASRSTGPRSVSSPGARARPSSLSSATSPPTLTSDLSYTAEDILQDFIAAGAHPFTIQQNGTISAWTGGAFSVSVPASSSVTFGDASDCNGPGEPRTMGLWVYQDNTAADQAYNEVSEENNQAMMHPPQGLSLVPTTIFLHACCLLLGADTFPLAVQSPGLCSKQSIHQSCLSPSDSPCFGGTWICASVWRMGGWIPGSACEAISVVAFTR
jgi:hypothetical protein